MGHPVHRIRQATCLSRADGDCRLWNSQWQGTTATCSGPSTLDVLRSHLPIRVAAWHVFNASSTMAVAVSGRCDRPSSSGSVKGPRTWEALEATEIDCDCTGVGVGDCEFADEELISNLSMPQTLPMYCLILPNVLKVLPPPLSPQRNFHRKPVYLYLGACGVDHPITPGYHREFPCSYSTMDNLQFGDAS